MKSGFTTLAKILALCCILVLISGYAWWRYDQGKQEEARQVEERKAAEAARKAQENLESMFNRRVAP